MSFLKDWWITDYAKDVANTLREKENHRIPFNFRSPQLHYRGHLVKWMCRISEALNLNNTTVHLAVYILDIFMDNHSIALESLNLITLTSILLAAKFEERDLNVPKVVDLNALIENPYPLSDFIAMECMTLSFLKWSVLYPTAAHFAEFYVTYISSPADMDSSNNFKSYADLQYAAQQLMKESLDYSLQDPKFHFFSPSLVAASCIALARIQLHLKQKWTSVLLKVTQYGLHELKPCVDLLTEVLHSCYPSNTATNGTKKRKLTESPDHGYSTCTSETNSPEVSHKISA